MQETQAYKDFIPGSGRSPWSRKWQHTLVYLPGKSDGQRNLEDYSPWGCKKSHTHTDSAHTHTHTHTHTHRASFSASSLFSSSLLLRSHQEKSSYIRWLWLDDMIISEPIRMTREIPYSDWSDLSPGLEEPTLIPMYRSEGGEGSQAPEENGIIITQSRMSGCLVART